VPDYKTRETPEGPILNDERIAQALAEVASRALVLIGFTEQGRFVVLISNGDLALDKKAVAAIEISTWAADDDLLKAVRYALGRHFSKGVKVE
jgi:hypothetical protein